MALGGGPAGVANDKTVQAGIQQANNNRENAASKPPVTSSNNYPNLNNTPTGLGPVGSARPQVSKPSSGPTSSGGGTTTNDRGYGGTTINDRGFSGTSGNFGTDSGNSGTSGNFGTDSGNNDTADQSTKPSGDNDYDWWQMHDGIGGTGGGTGGSGPTPSGTNPSTGSVDGGAAAGEPFDLEAGKPQAYNPPELDGPNPERIDHVDTSTLVEMLQQIIDAQRQQTEQSTDHAVEQGIKDLNRALEDAAKQYDTQRDQVAADEAMALDNQALYSEARGDRGGIGKAQYDSIQNTAAMNRRAVNDAQVKLSTDTARQIEDLRAQGEFEKADNLLGLTQSHLSQLMSLEQWAMQTNLGVDEFNSQLQQWADEFNLRMQEYLTNLDLSAAQLTGMFSDGTMTAEAHERLKTALAQSGNALLQAGIMPTAQQLRAMGMTADQAQLYLKKKGF